MNRLLITVILFMLFGIINKVNSQNCSVKGTVTDKLTNENIPYVNITLTLVNDSTIMYGSITDDNGNYKVTKLPAGKYCVKFSFIGYQSTIIKDIQLQPGIRDLGINSLNLLIENLPDVEIIASKPAITYKIDKKIIDAGSFPDAINAIDLLENVPSLRVDLEGNLTYRGEGTFKILINGSPAANGEDKLRSLPAEQIDRIEVITNPSAKYDAEGTAGIINVIMKKNRLEGYMIDIIATGTTIGEFGTVFSIDNKKPKYGWYLRGKYSHDVLEKYNMLESIDVKTSSNDYNNVIESAWTKSINSNYLELGYNYVMNVKNIFDFSGYLNPFKNQNLSIGQGEISENELSNSESNSEILYGYSSRKEVSYKYIGATLSYERIFDKSKNHSLSTYFNYSGYLKNLWEKHVDSKIFPGLVEKTGYLGTEQNQIVVESKVAYSFPVSEEISFEIGSEMDIDRIPKLTSQSGIFNDEGRITPFSIEPINQEVEYQQIINSGFITTKGEWDKAGIQFGLRTEFTNRKSDLKMIGNSGEAFHIPANNKFIDFFPSVHTNYNFSETHQISASFTRRIQRPGYWNLIPLKQYDSPYGYYMGNANLLPSYSNAYDLGYKKSWDKDFIAFELFSTRSLNIIQNYFRADTSNMLFFTPENVGKSLSIGTELMTGLTILPWWNINLSTSTYYYRIDTRIKNLTNSENQIRSDVVWNNDFMLPKDFGFKWAVHYNSPMIFSQGRQSGYLYNNFSISKIFYKVWTITIVANDAFAGIKYTVETSGENYKIHQKLEMKPYFALKLAYSFNNQE